jgi:hypothetical protein
LDDANEQMKKVREVLRTSRDVEGGS